MPYAGETFRIYYRARNFTSGLTDVKMVVYKPNGIKQGVYTLDELNMGDGVGIYYWDYADSDIAGTYLFVVNSASTPLKDARQVFFENKVWSDNEKEQIRDSLGVDGSKTDSQNGKINNIYTWVEFIKDIEGGRWLLDENNNQMIFYKDDNVTEIARFNLTDFSGDPTVTNVAERNRV